MFCIFLFVFNLTLFPEKKKQTKQGRYNIDNKNVCYQNGLGYLLWLKHEPGS